jgi:hypothetical protein
MKVLFNKNMTAVIYQAILESQKRYWPMSQTSRTSGWRKQNLLIGVSIQTARTYDSQAYQIIRDVYSTIAATTTVKIRPGTRPRTEYDHGNDMMARQIYSEKSKAAVYTSTRG